MRAPERDKETLKNNVTFFFLLFFFKKSGQVSTLQSTSHEITLLVRLLDYYRYGYKNNIATDPIEPR